MNLGDVKELTFEGDTYNVRIRRLWQVLFELYKDHGCDLSNLDNLLIDYDNCKKVFGEEDNFIWGCDPKYFRTVWDIVSEKDDFKGLSHIYPTCIFYEFEVTRDKVTYRRLESHVQANAN